MSDFVERYVKDVASTKTVVLPAEAKVNFDPVKTTAVVQGAKFGIPEGVGLREASKILDKMADALEEVVHRTHVFKGLPIDAAWVATQVLDKEFAANIPAEMQGFWGPIPPRMIPIQLWNGEIVHAYWGEVKFIQYNGAKATFGIAKDKDGYPTLSITFAYQKKYEEKFEGVVKAIHTNLSSKSVFAGKAIKVRFNDDDPTEFDPALVPIFLNPKQKFSDVILPKDIEDMVRVHMISAVTKRARAKEVGLPFKRGVLVAGDPGTGKSMSIAALMTACEEHGVTAILVANTRHLKHAIPMANMLAPAVLICEDVDTIFNEAVGNPKSEAEISDLLNALDGISNKDTEVMFVLTTNRPESIQERFLRGQRIGVTINFRLPGSEEAIRLVRAYAKGQIDNNEDLTTAGTILDGFRAADIAEVVRSAQRAMVARTDVGDPTDLKASDIEIAARDRLAQLGDIKKSRQNPGPDITKATVFAQMLGAEIARGQEAAAASLFAHIHTLGETTYRARAAQGNSTAHDPAAPPSA